MELAGPARHAEVPLWPWDPPTSCLEVVQRLIIKAGFSKVVVWAAAVDLRCSTAALYRFKWTRFLDWCDRRGVDPFKASILQVAEFFLFLRQELCLSVPAGKGYQAALNHMFSLIGMELTASSVVSRMFRSFERLCLPREIQPPDWNFSPVLRCLSRSPFEPLKLASDKHLARKTSFLLALALAKRVSELQGLSFCVCHSCGWRSCTFSFLPDLVV